MKFEKVPCVRTGILNFPTGYSIVHHGGDHKKFINNDPVDLACYPSLEPLCNDIQTQYDFSGLMPGISLVWAKNKNPMLLCSCGYFRNVEDDFIVLASHEKAGNVWKCQIDAFDFYYCNIDEVAV